MTAEAFFDAARLHKRELTGNPRAVLTQGDVDALNTVLGRWRHEEAPRPEGAIAWGAKVSPIFRARVQWIAEQLNLSPDDIMACMAWESGRTFSASIRNMAGSGATGLIQFMPATARALGTTTDALAAMTAEDQLNYVYRYFEPYKGKLQNLSDLYASILWPKAVGKPEDYVLWDRAKMPKTFRQNAGLDLNKDGKVTKAECSTKLYAMREEGLKPGNLG